MKLTIGKKLVGSFLGVAAITLVLGLAGYYGAVKSSQAINEIGRIRLPGVQSLLIVETSANQIKSAQRTLLNPMLSAEARQRQPEIVTKAREKYRDAMKTYEALPKTTEESAVWSEFGPALVQWREDNEKFFKLDREIEALGIKNPTAVQRDLQQFTADHYRLSALLQNHIQSGDECKGGDDPAACNYGKWLVKFDSTNPELKRLVSETQPSHAAFHAAVKKAKELTARGDKDGATAIVRSELEPARTRTLAGFTGMLTEVTKVTEMNEALEHQALVVCRASMEKAMDRLQKLVDINAATAAAEAKAADTQAGTLKATTIAAMIIGVTLSLTLGLLISRGINKALRRIAETLSGGADQTAAAAGQVSSASQSLAQGASEQAASLEETSASMEEMSSMTHKNAETAQQAAALSAEAKQAVDDGNAAMAKMSTAIKAIEKSAGETAKIIKVIDEIAFQTNLLALNAAVEAARAGDAGKGFAVVAAEVRSLAQRSAEAAKNTAALIEESVGNARNGVAMSTDVTKVIDRVTACNAKVNGLIGEIAAASDEQAKGLSQVNTAVSQMDKVTQSNAANAEESASASEELAAQAMSLNATVRELLVLVNGPAAADAAETGSPAPTRSRGLEAKAQSATAGPLKLRKPAASQIPLNEREQGFSAFNKAA